MSPPEKRDGRPIPGNGRPNARQPTTSTPSSVQATADTIAGVPAAVFRVIYTLGFVSGREVERIAQEQHVPYYVDEPAFAEHINRLAGMPTHAELEARRYPGHTPEELRKLREWCPA